jgi:hypothetical protein
MTPNIDPDHPKCSAARAPTAFVSATAWSISVSTWRSSAACRPLIVPTSMPLESFVLARMSAATSSTLGAMSIG